MLGKGNSKATLHDLSADFVGSIFFNLPTRYVDHV